MRPKKRLCEVERYEVEPAVAGLAERRTRQIILAAIHEHNPLRAIALSCYLQGIEDGSDAAWRNQERAQCGRDAE